MRDTFVRERRRRRHPKKPKNLFFNPITIETLKTKIVSFFFRSLDTKKGTKVLILPSKIHTQCSDIYYPFLTIGSSNDDVLIAF